jgi:hypothetical protein
MSMQMAPRQMDLFKARGKGLAEQFLDFHVQNPEVYVELRTLALQMRRRGVEQYGIGGLFEVLRWHRRMQTVDQASEFKLNNNYRSFYARLLMDNEPELDGFFELRTLRWQTYEVN